MKVVILAGGFGTRLSEYTELIPKPMVSIGNKPILFHIMQIYSKFGFNDFYIALGYKSEVILEYFKNYKSSEEIINEENKNNKNISSYNIKDLNWNVNLIYTGEKTMTGGRIKRMKKFIGNETFLLTYGDGLSNVDINKLKEFHFKHGKIVTVTAVRPPARFGTLVLEGNKVINFREKSQMDEGWVNGGYFVINSKFLDHINDDSTFLEREPLENLSKSGDLQAYKHEGFWQPMDSKRDRDRLEEMYLKGDTPWII